MPSTLGILYPASHDLGWFQLFWKGQSSASVFFRACHISPVQIGSHVPLLLRRWKRPSAEAAACHVAASCGQTILPMVGKLSMSLHGFLWVLPCCSTGHHVSCFSIMVTEVCFTPGCHSSLSCSSVPQIQSSDCEPNCVLKRVGYHCPRKNVFCPMQEKLTWNQK